MKAKLIIFSVCALVLVALSCKKKSEVTTSTAATSSTTATASTTATGAAETTSAAPSTAASTGTEAETTAKLEGAAWAMRQDEIKNDPNGQWAIDGTASSEYNKQPGSVNYSAKAATGAPDVEAYGDSSNAWTPATPDAGIEWLDLTFAKPVHATEVRVRESAGSGAVVKIELFDEHGAPHTVWSGADPTKDLNYLIVKFPKTDYKTNRVKVTLATNVVPGWNEIDAVQLVGTES